MWFVKLISEIASAIESMIFFVILFGFASFVFWLVFFDFLKDTSYNLQSNTQGIVSKVSNDTIVKIRKYKYKGSLKYDTIIKKDDYPIYKIFYKYKVNEVAYDDSYSFGRDSIEFYRFNKKIGDTLFVKYNKNFPDDSKIRDFNTTTIGSYIGLSIATFFYILFLTLFVRAMIKNFLEISLARSTNNKWENFDVFDLILIFLFWGVLLMQIAGLYYSYIRYL